LLLFASPSLCVAIAENAKKNEHKKIQIFNHFVVTNADTPPQTPPNMKFNTTNSTTAGNERVKMK
jgi:hypothetical protein